MGAIRRPLTILYRGPLSSCNYDCWYCPFAKVHETAGQLRGDQSALDRFVDWCLTQSEFELSLFFTPWGEALHRRWYQVAIQRLSRCDHVQTVAVQTNLSASLDWIKDCKTSSAALCCTYHPSQTSREMFLSQCAILDSMKVKHSVGMVGLRENFTEIESMRAELPNQTYLWINAYKDVPYYYESGEIEWLEQIDPHFRTNTIDYPSLGKACDTGNSVISVDGEGHVRRCHFIKHVIGNIYQPNFDFVLRERPCTRGTCECHIGYIHMPELKLRDVYQDGLLARIPVIW